MANVSDQYEQFYAKDRQTWRKWLAKNHEKSPGIWLIYYKKQSGKSRVAYEDAVEEALCFGWIDSTARPGNEDYYLQLFTPRKDKSVWSALNKSRVEQLIAEGWMTEAGLKKIETAKRNGQWNSLDEVESLTIPSDLQKALSRSKKAMAFFEGQAKSTRKATLQWLATAKRKETRAARIKEIVAAARESRRPAPFQRIVKPK